MGTRIALEICVDAPASLEAAVAGGADRLELCSALPLGGTTPSAGLIDAARALTDRELCVLLRPRAADFLYTERELDVVWRDLEHARALGADSVVFGALCADGDVDARAIERMIAEADPLPLTFHRAFDLCREPLAALDVLLELGVGRLLTSGCAPRVEDGLDLAGELVRRAGEQLEVVLGGGLTADVLARVVTSTGARAVHASARGPCASAMRHRVADTSLGDGRDEYVRSEASVERVAALRSALDELDR